MNRAIHRDIVAVQLLPESEWKTKESNVEIIGKKIRTAKVVGIFKRNWRE